MNKYTHTIKSKYFNVSPNAKQYNVSRLKVGIICLEIRSD